MPASARASGQDLFGLGARAAALGGSASLAAGYEAVYHNPAALADERGRQLTLGLVGVRPALRLHGDLRDAPDTDAALVGVVLPLPLLGGWRDRVGLGLGVWLPTDVVVAADLPGLRVPRYALLEQRPRTVGVHFGVGVRPADGVAVGAGFLALASLAGAIDVRPTDGGVVTAVVEDELLADYAPIVGVTLGAPAGALGAAVVFRGESVARFDVPLDAELGEGACLGALCLGVPVMDIEGVAQYDPAQVRADARWRRGAWSLTAGATFRAWSRFPPPIRPPVPDSPPHPDPAFEDTVGVSAGAEGRVGAFAVRIASAYEPTPVRGAARAQGLFDAARAVVAAGVGRDAGRVRIDAFTAVHELLHPGAGRILVFGLQMGAVL